MSWINKKKLRSKKNVDANIPSPSWSISAKGLMNKLRIRVHRIPIMGRGSDSNKIFARVLFNWSWRRTCQRSLAPEERLYIVWSGSLVEKPSQTKPANKKQLSFDNKEWIASMTDWYEIEMAQDRNVWLVWFWLIAFSLFLAECEGFF